MNVWMWKVVFVGLVAISLMAVGEVRGAPHVHDGHCLSMLMRLIEIDQEIYKIKSSREFAAAEILVDVRWRMWRDSRNFLDAAIASGVQDVIRMATRIEDAMWIAYKKAADDFEEDYLCVIDELEDEFRRILYKLDEICPIS